MHLSRLSLLLEEEVQFTLTTQIKKVLLGIKETKLDSLKVKWKLILM